MASLFMNPSECGPINDLKSLGNRIDVDGRARRDGYHPNLPGSSRNVHKPFQALPQSTGFSINSPTQSTSQSRNVRPPQSVFSPPPAHAHALPQPQPPQFSPPPHLHFPSNPQIAPQSRHNNPSTANSSSWVQSYHATINNRPPSGSQRTFGQDTSPSAWAQEHSEQRSSSQSTRLENGPYTQARESARSAGHVRLQGSDLWGLGSLGGPRSGFEVGWHQPGLHAMSMPMTHQGQMSTHHHAQYHPHASHLDPVGAFTSYAPITSDVQVDSDLSRTAKEILEIPAVQTGMSTTEGDVDNPFASSEFFKLMQDLALDGGESLGSSSKHHEIEDEDAQHGKDQRETEEERSNCFFGGFDDGIQEGTEVNATSSSSALNLDHAIPSTAQPVFDTEGRWVPFHRARAFKESKMDVPDQVRRALEEVEAERYRRSRMGVGRQEEGGEHEQDQDEEDGFDTEGLLEFYGQARVRSVDGSGPRMVGNGMSPMMTSLGVTAARERQAQREHLERGLTGTTGRETDELLGFTETHLDKILSEERSDEMRSQGYGQDRRKFEPVGLDGQYLFVSGNPFVKRQQVGYGSGKLDEGRAGIMEMQYQNLLEHEARVLDDPQSSRAWFDLAIKQQELERDDQAIRALLQCIALDPDCKEAYLALSVSYTNEGMIREGHSVLERWVGGEGKAGQDSDVGRLELGQNKLERHRILTKELMRMARMMPEGDIDADVQVALGVLFNASEEYDKAQDCFRAALFARQDDWMLYNRLGATLANGGRSEEALQYYEQALALNPGYVRAMFNVGISLIKLARYREAAIYILDAIRLQHSDTSSNAQSMKSVTSDILWTTLATTCMHLDRHDLMDACSARDLDVLEQEFQEFK